MNVLALILAAFFVTPSQFRGEKPVELSGDMRADWTNHAATASVCYVDVPPQPHILQLWQKLGVKVYKRIRFDPECSVEYVRRRAGLLAVHEGVDGIWLADEGKYPETWKKAFAEAQIDADAALYAKSLAEQALKMRATNHKIWIEGRRVMWFLRFMDFECENVDTLRLEFVCYAKRLEQLLNVPEKKLALEVAKPITPDRTAFTPLKGLNPTNALMTVEGGKFEISPGLVFTCNLRGFKFTITSRDPFVGSHPGGKGSFRLWISDGSGGYLPYEFQIDFTPVALENRAPTDCWGLWFQEDRWLNGLNQLYTSRPTLWRIRPNPRLSYSSRYPRLEPAFRFTPAKDQKGWTLEIGFNWFDLWGHWPSVRNGVAERWFVSLDALPGVRPAMARIDWPRGREFNYGRLVSCITCDEISSRYDTEKDKTYGVYHLWYDERLYGFLKTKKPTYQRCDTESDKVFWERVVEPMMDANKNLEEITRVSKDRDGHKIPAKLEKADATTKQLVYKSLGRLFNLAERVSVARRDYILQRYAGGIPPEPKPKEKPVGAAAVKAPDVDNDDDAIQLDDKEF